MTRLLVLVSLVAACSGPAPSAPPPRLPGDRPIDDAPAPAPAAADPWQGRTDLIAPPPASPPAKVALPASEELTLGNGLRVVIIPSPRLPLVSVQLAVKAGRADEPKVQLGVASFAAEMLAKGTQGKSALAIAKAVDEVGGRLAVDASFEATLLSCDVLSQHLDVCLGTLSDMVRAPTFPAAEMPKVRELLLAEVRQRLDDAGQIASTHFQNLLWGNDHVRGWVLSAEAVAAITRDNLVSWHQNRYSPDSSLLVIAGAVDVAKLKKDLVRRFGGWKQRRTPPHPTYREPRLSGIKVRLVDKPGQSQSHIRVGQLGIRHDDPRFFDTLVWNYALGGGAFSSRLMKVVRAEGGKTYGASSTFDRNLDRGSFLVSTFTRSAETVATTKLLIDEMAKMDKQGPSDGEVADAIANLAGSHALRFESARDVAGALIAAELHGFGREYLENYPIRIGQVDVASARAAASDILDASAFVIVIVGDAAAVEPQLEQAGWRYEKVAYTDPIGDAEPAPRGAADPKLEQAGRRLLDEALAKKGGKAKLAGLKTLTMNAKGKLTAAGQTVDVEIARQLELPQRMRVDLTLAGGIAIAYAFDGKAGWQSSPQGVADVPASQLASLERQRWLEPELILLRHLDAGARVEALADDATSPTRAVNVSSADGKHTVTLFINRKTKLVDRMAYPEAAGVTTDSYSDYRQVDGIWIAHRRDSKGANESASLELVTAALNQPIDPKVFQRPAKQP